MSVKGKASGRKSRRPRTIPRSRIVRKSLEELVRLNVQPDYARLDAMTEEDIARQIAEDPDAPEFTDEMFAQATWFPPPSKQLLSLRIDRDIVQWFRGTGKNYQTRMNAVLRSYVRHHKKRTKR